MHTGTAKQNLFVSSSKLTVNEAVASLRKATGASQWNTEYVKENRSDQNGREARHAWRNWRGTLNNFATDAKLAKSMLGPPEEELDEVVARVLKEGIDVSRLFPGGVL